VHSHSKPMSCKKDTSAAGRPRPVHCTCRPGRLRRSRARCSGKNRERGAVRVDTNLKQSGARGGGRPTTEKKAGGSGGGAAARAAAHGSGEGGGSGGAPVCCRGLQLRFQRVTIRLSIELAAAGLQQLQGRRSPQHC